jgi:hypothetical protein
MRLEYKSFAHDKKEAVLAQKPAFEKYVGDLERIIKANPTQAAAERRKLKSGLEVKCYTRSIKAKSYSETMIFSKDEITIRYVVLPDNLIVVVDIFFP